MIGTIFTGGQAKRFLALPVPFSTNRAIDMLLFLQVFDDVYTELTMAILQFLQGKPSEEKVFRCFKALERFCCLSRREVPQFVKMIGPEPSKFNGMSTRVEELIGKINAHLSRV